MMSSNAAEQPLPPPMDETNDEKIENTIGSWGMYMAELRNVFHPETFFSSVDADDQTIDLVATFCPHGNIEILLKTCFSLFLLFLFPYAWLYYRDWETFAAGFHLAYLTQWGLFLTLLYSCSSTYNSYAARWFGYSPSNVAADWKLKLSWALYSMTAQLEVLVVVVFWIKVYDPKVITLDFVGISIHGVVLILLLVEALMINVTPLRMQQWSVTALPINALYTIWTGIHSVTDIKNPNIPDHYPDTDLLYSIIDWKGDFWGTFRTVLLLNFVASPFFYSVLWYLSVACGRRRYVSEKQQQEIMHHGSQAKNRIADGGGTDKPTGETAV